MFRLVQTEISLDRTATTPLQRQIAQAIKHRVLSGALKSGEALPSTRALATELRVSRNTVIAAYDQLIGEGYLDAHHRSRICVSESFACQQGSGQHVAEVRRFPIPSTPPLLSCPIPFRPCQPDVRLFPLATWNRMRTRALKRFGASLLDYQSQAAVLGLPSLREALAQYLRDSRGVRCQWHQVAITSGSQQALALLAQVLLAKANGRVLIEDPGYKGAQEAFRRAGARIKPLPVDDQGLVVPAKPIFADFVYTTPARQFPTGASMPLARRLALIEFAHRSKAMIVEDDYDSEFRYLHPPLPSLHSLDPHGIVINVGSMSKLLFPSLRIGYVVLPESLVEDFACARSAMDDHGPLIDQATLEEFIATGAFFTHVRRCRREYAVRLEALLEGVHRSKLPVSLPYADGGMNIAALLLPESDLSEDRLVHWLADRGFEAPGLSSYCLALRAKPGVLLGFAAFEPETIETLTRRLNGLHVPSGTTGKHLKRPPRKDDR
jgi:GntR family transcriptional regulator/MocR family aminotransferase